VRPIFAVACKEHGLPLAIRSDKARLSPRPVSAGCRGRVRRTLNQTDADTVGRQFAGAATTV
jgi:hypothetical protein